MSDISDSESDSDKSTVLGSQPPPTSQLTTLPPPSSQESTLHPPTKQSPTFLSSILSRILPRSWTLPHTDISTTGRNCALLDVVRADKGEHIKLPLTTMLSINQAFREATFNGLLGFEYKIPGKWRPGKRDSYIPDFESRIMWASSQLTVDFTRKEDSEYLDWRFPLEGLTKVKVIVPTDLTTSNHSLKRTRTSSQSQRPLGDDDYGTDEDPTAIKSLDRLMELTGVSLLIDISRFGDPNRAANILYAPYNDAGNASLIRSEITTFNLEKADPTSFVTLATVMAARWLRLLVENPDATVTIELSRSMGKYAGRSHKDTEESTPMSINSSQLRKELSLRVQGQYGIRRPRIDGNTEFNPEEYLKSCLLYSSSEVPVPIFDDQGKVLSTRKATLGDATRVFGQFTFEYK